MPLVSHQAQEAKEEKGFPRNASGLPSQTRAKKNRVSLFGFPQKCLWSPLKAQEEKEKRVSFPQRLWSPFPNPSQKKQGCPLLVSPRSTSGLPLKPKKKKKKRFPQKRLWSPFPTRAKKNGVSFVWFPPEVPLVSP